MQSKGPLTLAVVLILTGCATTSSTGTAKVVPCASLDPITFSGSSDTGETIRQVREYNAVWKEICK